MDSVVGRDGLVFADSEATGLNMEVKRGTMNLLGAETGVTYTIKEINTEDEEMNAFLFRLGCYSGEPVTIMSKKKNSCIIVIKDGRYSIDNMLAEAIIV